MFNKHSGKATTHIGHLIDVATDGGTNTTENWAMYMEICDAINATEEGPKDAAKALRRRFAVRDSATIKYTLLLLETCVKNCGKRFHLQIANKDFLQDMVKIISPKYNPSMETQITVLGLIQTWAFAFNKYAELKEVNKTYLELKSKGVEFPPHDPEKASPANIPPWSAPTVTPTDVGSARTGQPVQTHPGPRPPAGGLGGAPPATMAPAGQMSAERVAKLRSELQTVRQNCTVFSDMLNECSTGSNATAAAGDLELLEDLGMTCRQMQTRMQELLMTVQNEEVMGELLSVNDDLNNVFIRYDRFQRMRSGREGLEPPGDSSQLYPPPSYDPPRPSYDPYAPPTYSNNATTTAGSSGPTAAARGPPTVNPGGPAVANLIDLDDTPPVGQTSAAHPILSSVGPPVSHLTNDFANLGVGGGDDFDAFAQSRSSYDQQNVECAQLNDKESDFMEMQKWLMANPSTGGQSSSAAGVRSDTVSNDDFERFLSQRQQEAERQPTQPSNTTTGTGQRSNNEPLFSL